MESLTQTKAETTKTSLMVTDETAHELSSQAMNAMEPRAHALYFVEIMSLIQERRVMTVIQVMEMDEVIYVPLKLDLLEVEVQVRELSKV